jgi:hypothetical protein
MLNTYDSYSVGEVNGMIDLLLDALVAGSSSDLSTLRSMVASVGNRAEDYEYELNKIVEVADDLDDKVMVALDIFSNIGIELNSVHSDADKLSSIAELVRGSSELVANRVTQ